MILKFNKDVKITDNVIIEHIAKKFDIRISDINDNVCLINSVEYSYKLDQMLVDVTHASFISNLINVLEDEDILFELTIKIPHFSNEKTIDIVTREMIKNYGNLSNIHEHLKYEQNGVEWTFTYYKSQEMRKELEQFYPELLI